MRIVMACLVAFVLLAGAAPAGQDSGTLATWLDAYLRPFIETNNFTGALLVARAGQPVYGRAAGLASPAFNVANTDQTRFHLASISKAFTAAVVLALEDRGVLRTSDVVSRFIPGYPNGDQIRLEHLLVHNSGVPNIEDFPARPRYRPYTTAEVIAEFRDKPLDFEPGAQFRYSNSDYNLLAAVIERATSQTYGDVIERMVTAPLGLTSTLHGGDARRVVPHLADGTEPDGLRGVRFVPFLGWSAGVGSSSMISTTADLCRFADALFSGTLLKAASKEKLLNARGIFPYGWTDRERAGRKVKASGGRSPGFIVNLEYFLDDHTCVAILTNSYSSVGQVIAGDVSDMAAGRSAAPPPIAYAAPRPGQLAGLTGRYQLPANYYTPNATLTLRDRGDYLEAEWANGGINVVYPVGDDLFIDRTFWATLRFTRGSDGQVDGFTYQLLQDFVAKRIR